MMFRRTQEPFPAGKNVVVIRASSFSSLFVGLRCDTFFSSSTAVLWPSCNKDIAHLPGAYFATPAGEGKAAPLLFTLLLGCHALTSNLHPSWPLYTPLPKLRK